MKTITANQIEQFKGRIIDVRSPVEFAGERLGRAENVPLDVLSSEACKWNRSEPLLVMCKSGMRSKQAYDELAAAGFSNVTMLEGGIDACKKAGVHVICVRKTIPVMRQVLIGAGSLLLIGLILGLRHPAFLIIDWFVACGLVIAGVSGFCPMAKLLEVMPWNRVSALPPGNPAASSTKPDCCCSSSASSS